MERINPADSLFQGLKEKITNIDFDKELGVRKPAIEQAEQHVHKHRRPQAFYTRKQTTAAQRKKKRKTAQKSRRINRLVAQGKR